MTFTLRPATNSDRAAIESLVFGVLAEYGLAPDPNGTDADLQDIEAEYRRNGGTFDVLVNENGHIVGSVGLHATSASICEIRKMYLASSARGKGMGRRLLEHALAEAKSLGFSRVELETASVLKEAIALYESYGFKRFYPSHLSPPATQPTMSMSPNHSLNRTDRRSTAVPAGRFYRFEHIVTYSSGKVAIAWGTVAVILSDQGIANTE